MRRYLLLPSQPCCGRGTPGMSLLKITKQDGAGIQERRLPKPQPTSNRFDGRTTRWPMSLTFSAVPGVHMESIATATSAGPTHRVAAVAESRWAIIALAAGITFTCTIPTATRACAYATARSTPQVTTWATFGTSAKGTWLSSNGNQQFAPLPATQHRQKQQHELHPRLFAWVMAEARASTSQLRSTLICVSSFKIIAKCPGSMSVIEQQPLHRVWFCLLALSSAP